MKILAIETSCDETAAAVVEDGTKVISSAVATSSEMYKKYGGVVPEIAARQQLHYMYPVVNEALQPFTNGKIHYDKATIQEHIDALAVTVGPGLVGSLLIGVETAKTIAFITQKPLIPVNHVLAHMYANFLKTDQTGSQQGHMYANIKFPAISLVVSGGHTELYLMESVKKLTWLGGTLDDAAGEAFDKTARLLDFGTGGGVAIQNAAQSHSRKPTPYNFKLPRPMLHDDNLNFSFSGLKTAIVREWGKFEAHPDDLTNSFAYEVQEAVTDVLVIKTLLAAKTASAKSILISGGVSANVRLREKFISQIEKENLAVTFHCPPINLCTDNAVYIGSYAFFQGKRLPWEKIEAQPDLDVEVK